MEGISNIVKKVIGDISSQQIREHINIEEVFARAAKKNKITGVKVTGYKNNQLYITTDSPARLYQVNLLKKKILEDIRQEIPDIEKIFFKTG